MNRRRFLLCSGSIVAALGGCLNRERSDTPDATSDRTTTQTSRGDNRGETETIRPTDQHLVVVNMDDERHSVRVTVSAADDDVLIRTVGLAAAERRRFVLDIDEPGTYTISATVDEDATETWSISFDDYSVREGSDVFVEIDDGRPDVYWEE